MGWNLRSGVWANDGCESTGSYIQFQPTAAARQAAGDPRLSVAERYPTYASFQSKMVAAIDKLVWQRFFLCSDTQAALTRLLNAGVAAGVPANVGNLAQPNPIPACSNHVAHDFDGNGTSDVLWADSSGDYALWLMNGSKIVASGTLGNMSPWQVVGQRDFNGDGNADLLWRDPSGDIGMWLMNGTEVLSMPSLGNVPATWSVYGTGDMNGDGIGDVLWVDTSGDVAIWFMSGPAVSSSAMLGNVGTSWSVVGSTNGFVVWEDTSNDYAIWLVNGTSVTGAMLGNVTSNWVLSGVGDFNGDGQPDLLWRDNVSGTVAIWFLDGTSILTTATLGAVGGTWNIAQTGDYNGDGKSDIFWVDGSGNVAVWFIDGSTLLSSANIGQISGTWSVQAKNAE
jgi:hypothetical protein